MFEAIRAGASGYLPKHKPAVLEDVVKNVLEQGGAPVNPAIARKVLRMLSHMPKPVAATEEKPLPKAITEREKEILQHTVNG